MEKLLEKAGAKKKLQKQFTEEWFRHQLGLGFQEKYLWLKDSKYSAFLIIFDKLQIVEGGA